LRSKDFDTLATLYDPSYSFEDRRRLMQMKGDREAALRNNRLILADAWRSTVRLLATAGDRLSLHRILWTTGESGAASEIEMLALDEVTGDGRFVRTLLFDPDDRAAAGAELFERYVAGAADNIHSGSVEFARAFNDHDLERLRGLIPTDFYLDDHRRTGVGRLVGADEYLASLQALWELSHDLRSDTLYLLASAEHGHLVVAHWLGTNLEGGAFDAVFVLLTVLRGESVAGIEIFEIDDLEVAKARFAELGIEHGDVEPASAARH
jgi:hypothetical protein